MKIVADENIPFVREAFSALGEVTAMPGRAMTADALAGAEVLLVRSITKVNAELLDGSGIRFVGTATIGEDHVDKAYLARHGIGFASAPGCNANSVGQYIVSVLLTLAESFEFSLEGLRLGIVGVGNVGSRVFGKATALGMKCVLNDPPLAAATKGDVYRPIEEIHDCDIVTLHVPLTQEGPHATHHLAGERFLWNMRPGSILINSSRGPVVDEAALRGALESGHIRACVMDVWEGEPAIDAAMLERAFLGTPHIAGYSFDGKVNGTRQVYESACRFLDMRPQWDPSPLLPPPECPEVIVDGESADPFDALRAAVYAVYDVRKDDQAMRALLDADESERPGLFDQLRKEYPRRREFFNTKARIKPENEELRTRLAGIGFNFEEE